MIDSAKLFLNFTNSGHIHRRPYLHPQLRRLCPHHTKLAKAKNDKERSALPTCLCKCLKTKRDKDGNVICEKWKNEDWCCSGKVKGLGCESDNAIQSPAFKIITEKLDAVYQANC